MEVAAIAAAVAAADGGCVGGMSVGGDAADADAATAAAKEEKFAKMLRASYCEARWLKRTMNTSWRIPPGPRGVYEIACRALVVWNSVLASGEKTMGTNLQW